MWFETFFLWWVHTLCCLTIVRSMYGSRGRTPTHTLYFVHPPKNKQKTIYSVQGSLEIFKLLTQSSNSSTEGIPWLCFGPYPAAPCPEKATAQIRLGYGGGPRALIGVNAESIKARPETGCMGTGLSPTHKP